MTLDPEVNNTESAMTLAQAYLDAGNYRRAEEVLQSALTESPQDAMLLTAMALAQHLLGDYAAAERSALGALAVAPGEADPMRVYASILDSLGRNQEALSWARRAVDAAPLDPSTHYDLRGTPAQRRRRGGRPARGHRVVAPAAGRCRRPQHDWHGPLPTGSISRIDSGVRGGAATGARTRVGVAQHRCEPGEAQEVLQRACAGFARPRGWIPGIGDRVRHNVNATVLAWLRWMSFLAWVLLWVS